MVRDLEKVILARRMRSEGRLQREIAEASGVSVPTVATRAKLRAANLGAKRWNWKGGITPDRVRLRISLDMKLAREGCFERDNYTCRSCGQHGGRLNAHHVWPFQRFPEWKYEVWSLVTLCKRCHDAFHKAAGGPVRVAIGPFFSNNEVREPPLVGAYRTPKLCRHSGQT
jgi:hypothetical protein